MKNKIIIVIIFVLLLIPSIPIMDATNNQIIKNNENNFKIKDNLDKNIIISSRQKSSSTLEEKNISYIISSGEGRGYFFPPRAGRKKFFCVAAIIVYTSLFSSTLIKGEHYDGPQVLIFIGFARVWYTKRVVLRDDISLIGIGFAKVFFDL